MQPAKASDHGDRVVQLYRDYGPAVYRRCLRLLRDREAARDATQEVFVKLLRDIGKLTDRETALPWIYRVATNHCLNARRDARRRGEGSAGAELELVPSPPEPFPERRLAHEVLARFDVQTQAVAVGILVDGMEHEELAAALGISRRTVHRKLARFLERARSFLAGSES
ncbi:MAG TPA: sigma-70 family RNA polymerase sigma factor [Anaeromyxobacteraceae bacterium]|nr:sigma-70 family RNA polymerase sigma factor [Anaeromyxobacteraceae bacterium]